ncbi:unnamed protein product [Peniophora sp. CBMAI 1063]|nr:unnamed protein product [Peniophora sp. CBMAI 1063]
MSLTRLRAIASHLTHAPHSARAASMTIHNDNAGCCSQPAASSTYTPRGIYVPFAGFKRVYITGPKESSIAIISIYDIFGFKPQTQLGADMLADALHARVVMPDFFEPSEAWDVSRHPPQTDEDKAAFQKFFAGPAKPDEAVVKLERVVKALKEEGVKKVGAYGLCWGGKVAVLAGAKEGSVLDAIATAHPAMLKADDTLSLDIPFAIYVSKDEPQEEYNRIVKILQSKPFADKVDYDYYPTMFHGWAGARANLDDPENKRLFDEVYRRMGSYFGKILKA